VMKLLSAMTNDYDVDLRLPTNCLAILFLRFDVFGTHLLSSFHALRSKIDVGHIMMSAFTETA